MVALLASLVSLFSRNSKEPPLRNKYDLPWPNEIHRVIDESTLAKYKNVFVIGDVHGCHEELVELLAKANVNDSDTLKVFAGDMMCKGPDSLKVLRSMQAMAHVAVRGNNEEAVLRDLRGLKADPNYRMKAKYEWIRQLNDEEQSFIHELPYILSFPSLNAVVVHAGLLPGKTLRQQSPMNVVRMRNIIVSDYFEGNGLQAYEYPTKGEPWASLWPGPEHVYFGHDARRGLQMYKYATGLDTGCVYGYSLTGMFIHGPRKGEMVSVQAKKKYL